MTEFPLQMLRQEQLAPAVEGALQQMEEEQAGQRRSGFLDCFITPASYGPSLPHTQLPATPTHSADHAC